MASIVKIKRSSVQGKAPTASDIQAGELALNTRDGKLFSSDGSAVFEIGANLHSLSVGTGGLVIANGAITFPTTAGSNGQILSVDSSGNLTFVDSNEGLTEEEVLELLPFTTGYETNTIPVRDINVSIVDGANISDPDNDSFGVSLRDLYDNMEPTGRIESVDCGAFA